MINLIAWIGIGVIINFLLHQSEDLKSRENILGTIILVGMKSISGGILSNYIFQSGFGSVDLQTFTMLGIAPLILLIVAKVFRPYLT
jgi:hypothetical protein